MKADNVLKLATSLILLLQALTSSLQVHVSGTDYQPQADLTVHLELYDFASDGDDVVATVTITGECTTDANGACEIEIGETNGRLRGRLVVGGHGSRDVIWPGGVLELSVRLDQVNSGTEAQPYDYQEKDGGVILHSTFPWMSVVIVGFLVGGLVIAIYLRARKEHA